jgi:hypothetical protein
VRDLFSTGEAKGEAMNNPTSIGEQAQRRIGAAEKSGAVVKRVRSNVMWVNTIRTGVCVLALFLLLLTVGVGVGSELDISTAEARLAPTGIIAPTTAMLSRAPNPDGWNEDMARVILSARFKTH